jgi:adenine-specific DNA-methyltransferase
MTEEESNAEDQRLIDMLMALVPSDGSAIGNTMLKRTIDEQLKAQGSRLDEDAYWRVHASLVASGLLRKGQGRGGSVRRSGGEAGSSQPTDLADDENGFELQPQSAPVTAPSKAEVRRSSEHHAPTTHQGTHEPTQIIAYRHPDKRVNNPEVGMVTPATDPDAGNSKWSYDPHLDPSLNFDRTRSSIEALIDTALSSGDADHMRDALAELKRLQSPYLNWSGKAERTSFEVDTVSLHVHERVDPASILSAVRKAMNAEGKAGSKGAEKAIQPGLFDAPFENLPLRDAIDFYRHERGWANRLIAGDSLLVMNSLLQKESMAGRVQMIYIDPPYGIKYGSNFQPFVGKRDVKDRNDDDLTQEPEMIKAFRDTWELGIHSYLTYLRDRLLLARELLNDSGSIFVQISDENLHHVRELMDEILGPENLISQILYRRGGFQTSDNIPNTFDYVVWYAKEKAKLKFKPLMRAVPKNEWYAGQQKWFIDSNSGEVKQVKNEEDLTRGELLSHRAAYSASRSDASVFKVKVKGAEYMPPANRGWSTNEAGYQRLAKAGRIFGLGKSLRFRVKYEDYPLSILSNGWFDSISSGFGESKVYVVQTASLIVERCLLMTTDPGDLVLDPTCGSGTTAYVAEKWGRRWITADTSRVAVTLAKQRLMTASFDYFELKYPHEGLRGGFIYKTVPHATLRSIANNPEIDSIYDRMNPVIYEELRRLNKILQEKSVPAFTPGDGFRKGEKINLARESLFAWEVPFEWPNEWPEDAIHAFEDFHKARIQMQQKLDESIAAHAYQETLYDKPSISKNKLRITGSFTVEAVPFPSVKSLDESNGPQEADASIARTGESGRQHQWRDELLKTGIRGKGGQMLKFADLEALPTDATIRNLHATGHLDTGERIVVSFGPEHAALEQRQVQNALSEAERLFPAPKMIVFCAFTFDPEAAKDIDAKIGITALKAQMNTDLLTEDLKKAKSSNQSFWLMGQPEVEVRLRKDGHYEVEVHGFDYFDTVKGELVSGGKSKIAMWALDTDYDERSLFPKQVFFPMAGKGEGWEKLKKNIRAELDESKLEKFHGTVSLPFEAGDNRKIAVKIVDDRGIESLKVLSLD